MIIDPFCALLAMLNVIETWLNFKDWKNAPTPKRFWATAAWAGSSIFWIVRGIMPV